jgi:type II secretory pathway component PulJ
MGTIIGALMARGLSEKVARLVAYLGGALLLLGAFAGLVAAYNHHVIGQHEAKIIARAKPATDQAANERAVDTITNAKNEEEAHNAIHSVPDAAPAAPSHQLACQRLRKLGRNPAACR